MSERMYIEICDPGDVTRALSVPRAGAIVTQTSEVRNSKQIPVTRIHYGLVIVTLYEITRRDVVDALESGVDLTASWRIGGLADAETSDMTAQMALLGDILRGPDDDEPGTPARSTDWVAEARTAMGPLGPLLPSLLPRPNQPNPYPRRPRHKKR